MFRKAVAILLAFFLLWGNSGFCLNVHYCATSEAFSVMVNHLLGERCGSDAEQHAEVAGTDLHPTGACCQKLKQPLPTAKKNCCSDTEVEVKITDAFHGAFSHFDFQKQWTKLLHIPLAPWFSTYTPIPAGARAADNDPPDTPPDVLPSGKHRLIQHSVFRI